MATLTYLDLPGLSAREALEPGFATALQAVADRLGLDPNYIGAVMSLESGFNPSARNANGGAVGLIQFMPATATALGTSSSALAQMTAIEQLPFVEAFYRQAGRAIRREEPGDYYMATFLPAFVGKPKDFILATKGEQIYDQNSGLDADGDGTLTVGDVTQKIETRVAQATARPRLLFQAQKKSQPPVELPSLRSAPPPLSAGSYGAHVGGIVSMLARDAVVLVASRELALVESGAFTPSRVNDYWASALHQAPNLPHPPAWCGALALFCLHDAALAPSLFWRFQTASDKRSGFLYALQRVKPEDELRRGDMGYQDQPYQHHFIVEAVDNNTVTTIEGNQGEPRPIQRRTRRRDDPALAWFSIKRLLKEDS